MLHQRNELIEFLTQAIRQVDNGESSLENANKRLKSVFLSQNSETPDNLAAVDNIELGESPTNYDISIFGLRIKNTDLLIADVVWRALDNEKGVSLILEEFPSLSTAQAEAILRFCVVILGNLQARVVLDEDEDEDQD